MSRKTENEITDYAWFLLGSGLLLKINMQKILTSQNANQQKTIVTACC